ncbi:rhomboid family intramembrane serine protease [Aquimarina agarilytica]|uniref:rhomboid family intramembrane serine protease n=1 Tax=Aquimarina agarilytica TaxID=1087449 RepID=UPI000289DC47|nr:rhomboid family intramembrane serine protease [Aquimarina agarilytica]
MPNLNNVVLLLIVANGIMSMTGFTNFEFFEKYKFNINAIQKGDKIRMFSSGFLHADWSHLIFNMYTLYIFSPIVISFLGNLNYLIIYVASLGLGSAFSYLFHKNEPHYSAIGASGAVSGILYASILLYPQMELFIMFIPIPIPAYVFGIGYLLYSIYGMRSNRDNIGHDAHFGGAVAGYIVTLALQPSLFQTSQLMVFLLAVPIILLYVLYKTGKI